MTYPKDPVGVWSDYLESHPVVAYAQTQVATTLQLLDLAFAAVHVISERMKNLDRLFAINPPKLLLSMFGPDKLAQTPNSCKTSSCELPAPFFFTGCFHVSTFRISFRFIIEGSRKNRLPHWICQNPQDFPGSREIAIRNEIYKRVQFLTLFSFAKFPHVFDHTLGSALRRFDLRYALLKVYFGASGVIPPAVLAASLAAFIFLVSSAF